MGSQGFRGEEMQKCQNKKERKYKFIFVEMLDGI